MKHRIPICMYLTIAILALQSLCGPVGVVAAQTSISAMHRTDASPNSDPVLANGDVPVSELRGLIERYASDRGSLFRFFGIEASASRQARMKQFYGEWLATLTKVDFDSMSQDGRVDYILFKNHLDHELRQLDIQKQALSEIAPLAPFARTIAELEDARRSMQAIDSPKTAALLTRMAKEIDATSKAVEAGLKPDARPTRSLMQSRSRDRSLIERSPRSTFNVRRSRTGSAFTTAMTRCSRGGSASPTGPSTPRSRNTSRSCAKRFSGLSQPTRPRLSAIPSVAKR